MYSVRSHRKAAVVAAVAFLGSAVLYCVTVAEDKAAAKC